MVKILPICSLLSKTPHSVAYQGHGKLVCKIQIYEKRWNDLYLSLEDGTIYRFICAFICEAETILGHKFRKNHVT